MAVSVKMSDKIPRSTKSALSLMTDLQEMEIDMPRVDVSVEVIKLLALV